VFDLLAVGDEGLRSVPLLERRHRMHQHVEPVAGVKLIDHVETHGDPLFHAMAAQDFEGIVAKRLDAPYRAGRQRTWVKVKNREFSRAEALGWR